MAGGFGSPCDDDENGSIVTVLVHGAEFLKEHPKSRIAPDVSRMLAQANETAWCVASSDLPEESYQHVADFRAMADKHRGEALRLYDEYLRERPDDPRNKAIRARVRRMRQGIDTAYYRYWFSGD